MNKILVLEDASEYYSYKFYEYDQSILEVTLHKKGSIFLRLILISKDYEFDIEIRSLPYY